MNKKQLLSGKIFKGRQECPPHRGFIRCGIVALSLLLMISGCKKEDATPSTPAETNSKTITTSTGIEMSLIPAGTFTMGSATGDDDEKPPHSVTLASFYIDRCEVTQKSYEALMGSNPSKFKDPQKPVERTSWLSAIKYCNMRSMKEGLTPCYNLQTGDCSFAAGGYRLPTEAEWEYACRAGQTSEPADPSSSAWLKTNANQTTHAVGQKSGNAWGLYDMLGNVSEWCNDRYDEKGYDAKSSDNPHGPAAGNQRVLRGGSWKDAPAACRSSARASESPALADACFGSERYGFRCVRSAK